MKDETQEHIDKIISLVREGKKKIVLVNNSGEGKTFLIRKLKKQFKNLPEFSEFNIYEEDSFPIEEPYIMPVVGIESFDDDIDRPEPDAIYIPKYSKKYKDSVMGIDMPEGTTFRDYDREIRKKKIANTKKRNFKNIDEYKKYFNGE